MGETLKYLLVGSEEITLETIEVDVFLKTLHNNLIVLFACSCIIMIHVFIMCRSIAALQMNFMRLSH